MARTVYNVSRRKVIFLKVPYKYIHIICIQNWAQNANAVYILIIVITVDP